MSRLNFGDRVRVKLDDANLADVKQGDLGTVVSNSDDDIGLKVLMDHPDEDATVLTTEEGREFHWYFSEDNLDLVHEFINGNTTISDIAEAASKHSVMISVTVSPYGDE